MRDRVSLCLVASAMASSCGVDAPVGQALTPAAESRTQAVISTWTRTALVAYGETHFENTIELMDVTEIDDEQSFNFQRGAINSFVLYPNCRVKFVNRSGDTRKEYRQANSPLYNQTPSDSRDHWHQAKISCNEDLAIEDVMVYSDPNFGGDQLPLFTDGLGDDGTPLTYGWFTNETPQISSIDMINDVYVVASTTPEDTTTPVMNTTIVDDQSDLRTMGINDAITKLSVKPMPSGILYRCWEPRRCFQENTTCGYDGANNDIASGAAALSDCADSDGLSYCTEQGYCVNPSTGEPMYETITDDDR